MANWLAPVGTRCCDSSSSRVTESLSALGLGLNSSPGQPSRKCVSFLARQSCGAGERVCKLVEIHLHRWKNKSKFMTRWLQRCDCEGWSRLFCFSPNRPKWMDPDQCLVHVSSYLGRQNTSSTGRESHFTSPWGKAILVTLQPSSFSSKTNITQA